MAVDDGLPYIYGLELPTRALAASKADEDNVIFFIGTQSLRHENQFVSVTFDEELGTAVPVIYNHSCGEIWQILSSPTDKQLVATVYSSYETAGPLNNCRLWKMPLIDEELYGTPGDSLSASPSLTSLSSFDNSKWPSITTCSWHPEDNSKIAVFSEDAIGIWNIDLEDQSKLTDLGSRSHSIFSGVWSPHRRGAEIYVLCDSTLRIIDSSTGLQTDSVDNCHSSQIRDIDFNPFDEFSFATCGDDCGTRFWDRRKLSEPLRVQCDHSHWVWRVRYNLLHDELLLTSSSDGHVLLSNFASLSSQSSLTAADDSTDSDAEGMALRTESFTEGVLKKYEDHEDSVYGIEWSPANPWFFASLSFDGRLVINRVPQHISDAMTLK